MKDLLTLENGVATIAVALSINAVVLVGKLLWKLFEKKTAETETDHKNLEKKTSEKDKEIEAKANELYAKLARVEGQLDSISGQQIQRLSNLVGSYMDNTIQLSTKLGGVEKQMEIVIEKMEKFDRQVDELKDLTRELRR